MVERTESGTREWLRVRRSAGKELLVKRAFTHNHCMVELSERVIAYSKGAHARLSSAR